LTVTRTDHTWDGPGRRLGRDEFERFITDRNDTLCFVCGPPSFVLDTTAVLLNLGVPRGAIRTEAGVAAIEPHKVPIAERRNGR
jgi:NAD(P)H-flavin reductase